MKKIFLIKSLIAENANTFSHLTNLWNRLHHVYLSSSSSLLHHHHHHPHRHHHHHHPHHHHHHPYHRHHHYHHCHGDHPHHDINVTVAIINVGAQRLPNGVELMEAKKREIGRSDKRKKCLDLDHNDHSDQRYHHHHCHYDFSLKG